MDHDNLTYLRWKGGKEGCREGGKEERRKGGGQERETKDEGFYVSHIKRPVVRQP